MKETIDLRKCKGGDILISTHGAKLEYIAPTPWKYYTYLDHVVRYIEDKDGKGFGEENYGTRTNDGFVYAKNRKPEVDHDIIKVIKMKETRATRAEKILRDAYESGKLRRGRCTSCAVGILIADGMGYTVTDGGSWKEDLPNWAIAFSTNSSGEQRNARILELFLDEPVPEDKINDIIEYYNKVLEFDIDKIETELKSTEFTIPELMKIEYTFETAPGGLEDKLNAAIELIHGLDKK